MYKYKPYNLRCPQIGQLIGSRGLTLIEVMIALLVLSIGLVGLASIHLVSLKAAHSSYYRSLASTAALNIEERLWEEARESLDSEGECIADATLNDIATEIQNRWRPGGSSNFSWGDNVTASASAGIPGLTVTFGMIDPDDVTRVDNSNNGTWTDAWRQIPVTLTWTESRLGDAGDGEQFQESFDYTVRIACVPQFFPDST